jgi:hypothetical protein
MSRNIMFVVMYHRHEYWVLINQVLQFFWMHVIVVVCPLHFSIRTLDTNITNEFGYWLLSSYRQVTALAAAQL